MKNKGETKKKKKKILEGTKIEQTPYFKDQKYSLPL